MSMWMLIVAATAAGGALVVWNAVTRTKHVSEQMLATYTDMLAEVRKAKAKSLSDEADDEKTTAAPPDKP